jgi:hypothetical protein
MKPEATARSVLKLEPYLERIEPRQFRLLLSGALLVAAVLLTSLLWPHIREYQALRHSYAVLLRASANPVELARQLTTLRGESKKLHHRLHGDLGNLPQEQVESHVIGLLQRLCWRHHLELASVVPSPGETVQMFQETVLDLEVRGDFLDFFNLLRDMQDELGFLVVKQYEITPMEPYKVPPRLNVKLQISTYRSMEP